MIRKNLRPVDVAREFNRSADWLRGLEREGVIPRAKRDFSGHRFYSPEDVAEIRRIVLGASAPQPSRVAP